jgi:hypothetical protein
MPWVAVFCIVQLQCYLLSFKTILIFYYEKQITQ